MRPTAVRTHGRDRVRPDGVFREPPIPTTGGVGSPLVFTGAGQGGQIDYTSTGIGTIPAAYSYTLVDNVSAGAGEYYVQLDLSVPTITWTGQNNGNGAADVNWTTLTSDKNWANGTSPTSYSDNSYVVKFTDTNAANGNSPITNSNISIVPSTVSPLGMNFTASSTNYTFSGGAITGGSDSFEWRCLGHLRKRQQLHRPR